MNKYKLSGKMEQDGITQEMLDSYAIGEDLLSQGDAMQYKAQYHPESYNFDVDEYENLMKEGQELRVKGFALMEAYESVL